MIILVPQLDQHAGAIPQWVNDLSSFRRCVVLRALYHRARISEYWIIEDLGKKVELELLVWQPQGYVASPAAGGSVHSPVFGKQFQITVTENRSANPVYHVTTD